MQRVIRIKKSKGNNNNMQVSDKTGTTWVANPAQSQLADEGINDMTVD